MHVRRFVTSAASAIAVCGLLTAPHAFAGPRHSAAPHRPAATSRTVGHLAWVTKNHTIKLAAVHLDGATSAVKTIGPVSPVTGKRTVGIFAFMASGDGKWLAWEELVLSAGGNEIGPPLLVVREQSTHTVIKIPTEQAPVGFAGDQLITSDGVVTKRLVLSPSPHLVKLFSDEDSLTTYPGGVVEAISTVAPPGPNQTWKVELRSLGGTRAVLHSYLLAPTNYRLPEQAWTSADGKHLLVERGDHTDFDGLGPSSLTDEFALTGSHQRTQLGHYGTDAAKWRVAAVSFAGKHDAVWAVWARGTKTGATTVVARHADGTWAPVLNHGIAVAGNAAGFKVVQPGKYVSVGHDAPQFDPVPTGHALLRHLGHVRTLNAEGSVFVWVNG
jgi:hypothetical protein